MFPVGWTKSGLISLPRKIKKHTHTQSGLFTLICYSKHESTWSNRIWKSLGGIRVLEREKGLSKVKMIEFFFFNLIILRSYKVQKCIVKIKIFRENVAKVNLWYHTHSCAHKMRDTNWGMNRHIKRPNSYVTIVRCKAYISSVSPHLKSTSMIKSYLALILSVAFDKFDIIFSKLHFSIN